jgi:hypothetical protein
MDSIVIPVVEIQSALDAMYWSFSPYLEEPSQIEDSPWIVELINSYNSILSLLPEQISSEYEKIYF